MALFLCVLSGIKAQDYSENYRAWTDGLLMLDDFLGQKPKNDTSALNLGWSYKVEEKQVKIPHGRITYPTYVLYLNKSNSWIAPQYVNEHTLRVCQTSFDLLEVYRRKIVRDMANQTASSPNDICEYYINKHEQWFDEMCDSTRAGQLTEVMNRYAAEVDSMLADQEEPDPVSMPLGKLRGRFDLGLGVNLMGTSNDCYTNAPVGMSFSLLWGFRRNLFLMDMTANFGAKCKQDFDTDRGPIYKGDKVNPLQAFIHYGFLVNPQSERAVYPLIGIGAVGITGKKLKGEDSAPDVTGFSFGVGCLLDIPLYRNIYKYNGMMRNYYLTPYGTPYGTSAQQTGVSLLLRPTVNFTSMPELNGLYPTFNLSLIVTWNGRAYDRR